MRVPFVYLLRCRDRSLYAGAAKDLLARLRAHASGRASRYTRARLPVALVWSRRVPTWSAALRLEHRIKQLEKSEKEALVVATVRRRERGRGKGRVQRAGPATKVGTRPRQPAAK